MSVRIWDDRKRLLTFAAPPKRIVSLVPSDTYSVAMLGAGSSLVGRTDYCSLPEAVVAQIPSVGGTKNPRIEEVVALEPDLVIANQEENSKSDLERLAQLGVRVLIGFPKRVEESLAGLARLARVLGVEQTTSVRDLLSRGYEGVKASEAARANERPLRVFCPIWMDPLMTIHGSTFIGHVLQTAGAENVFAERVRKYPLAADLGLAPGWSGERVADRDVRYPRITSAELVASRPELVLLPDEPHPFTKDDEAALARMFDDAPVKPTFMHVSGKDLCWYGAWTVDGLPRVRTWVEKTRALRAS